MATPAVLLFVLLHGLLILLRNNGGEYFLYQLFENIKYL